MTFGVADVIAPLTPVNDERVVDSMVELHRALAAGVAPPDALAAVAGRRSPRPDGGALRRPRRVTTFATTCAPGISGPAVAHVRCDHRRALRGSGGRILGGSGSKPGLDSTSRGRVRTSCWRASSRATRTRGTSVVEQFAGLVWSVARSYRLSSAATDDVVQTVWLRLAEHCGRIREPDRLASWLATTTRHEALRVIRGNTRLSPHGRAVAEAAEPTASSIEDIVTDDVTLRRCWRRSPSCPQDDQQLLRLLCTVPPLDYQTIADMLGRSIGSIGPSRARCLDRLRRLLPAGIDPKEETVDDSATDDELLELLGPGASRVAGPRPRARASAAARAASTWRTIDQELAELVFDSATELTGVRSEDAARQLTFRAQGVRDRDHDGRRRRAGARRPARPGPGDHGHARRQRRARSSAADQHGRFSFDRVPPGPVRLSVSRPTARGSVTTDWVLL